MSYTSKYMGNEIDELLDKVKSGESGSRIVLWEGKLYKDNTATLSQSIENFDYITIDYRYHLNNAPTIFRLLPTSFIDTKDIKGFYSAENRYPLNDYVNAKDNLQVQGFIAFINETTCQFADVLNTSSAQDVHISRICGIKFNGNSKGVSSTKAFLQKKLENVSKDTAFDMDIIKNNGFELSNNRILLKANSTYSIRYSVEVFVNASEFGIATTLPMADDSEKWAILYAPSLSVQVGNAGERTIFVTPEQDTELTFITAPYGSSAVGYAWTRCIIEEF